MGRLPPGTAVLVAVAMFGAIVALKAVQGDAREAVLVLFVVPIALCAIEFGLAGGVVAVVAALTISVGWELSGHDRAGLLGIVTRGAAFLLVGGLLGRFVDGRRRLEAELSRFYDLSLDMLATANFAGYFEKVSPAWEKTLGYTPDVLSSRPFLEFVHPDDRERTQAETATLGEGIDTISFRNRYRAADGSYRWLEWNARADVEEQCIYAAARDVTAQHQAEQALQNQSETLERTVRARTRALEEAKLETLRLLARAAEYRDDDTYQHTERVGRTAGLIAEQLGLPGNTVELIQAAAPLHDIGKVGVSDTILLKPGRLTDAEFQKMQEHVAIGGQILADTTIPILQLAEQIAFTHHERWDGGGYPRGLRGEEIPLSGRIVAIADVFDALTHDRPYKRAWPIEAAVAEIKGLSGQHFDPRVVEAFTQLDHGRLLEPVQEHDPKDAAGTAPPNRTKALAAVGLSG